MQFDNDLGFHDKALPTDIAHNLGDFERITASLVKNTTIDDPSNTVTATHLLTSTGSVSLLGATAPSAGQVLTAVGSTAAAWTDSSVAVFSDQKTIGTNAGTFTAGSWVTRTLNTTTGNFAAASLSSNQMTIPAGRYKVVGMAPAHRCDGHQVRLRNITDGTTDMLGQTAHAAEIAAFPNIDMVTLAHLVGYLELTATKVYEFQHQCGITRLTDGLGVACGFGPEVYAVVSFTSVS